MSNQEERIRPLASEEAKKLLEQERFRCRVKEIIDEYIENVNFANIVKKYSAEEMDKRLFRSVKYWAIVIFTAIITSAIGFAIARFFQTLF
ncbi:MAG: hypothetical protein ABH887_01445 [bacterium]